MQEEATRRGLPEAPSQVVRRTLSLAAVACAVQIYILWHVVDAFDQYVGSFWRHGPPLPIWAVLNVVLAGGVTLWIVRRFAFRGPAYLFGVHALSAVPIAVGTAMLGDDLVLTPLYGFYFLTRAAAMLSLLHPAVPTYWFLRPAALLVSLGCVVVLSTRIGLLASAFSTLTGGMQLGHIAFFTLWAGEALLALALIIAAEQERRAA